MIICGIIMGGDLSMIIQDTGLKTIWTLGPFIKIGNTEGGAI